MANQKTCDALVLFGVTGDLVSKMILPALAELAQRGMVPAIVGVAHLPREPAALVDASRKRLGASDAALAGRMDELVPRLSIVTGDLEDGQTYTRLAAALKDFAQP